MIPPIIDFIIRIGQIFLFYYIYLKREKILNLLKHNQKKGTHLCKIVKTVFENTKIRFNSMLKSIILPIVLIGLLIIYFVKNNFSIICHNFSMLENLTAIIISPIYEEILFRGILLGTLIEFLYWISYKYIKFNKSKYTKFMVNVLSLFLISILFSFLHNGSVDLRYIAGIIFGLVYIIDHNNLLPSIIAHIVNNALIILIYC